MDGNGVRIQPVTTSPLGVQQAGHRESRKDAPPFDLEKEAKGGAKKDETKSETAGAETELPAVAPPKEGDAGSTLDVVA